MRAGSACETSVQRTGPHGAEPAGATAATGGHAASSNCVFSQPAGASVVALAAAWKGGGANVAPGVVHASWQSTADGPWASLVTSMASVLVPGSR